MLLYTTAVGHSVLAQGHTVYQRTDFPWDLRRRKWHGNSSNFETVPVSNFHHQHLLSLAEPLTAPVWRSPPYSRVIPTLNVAARRLKITRASN